MPYVERVLALLNGPPWGFRLQETYDEGLTVSRIRQRSPAEYAGLRENDIIVTINGISTHGLSHSQAVQIIDFASFSLEIIVGRYETKQKIETFFLENAFKPKELQQELSTRELKIIWQKEPTPEPLIIPKDPEVTPMSIEKLLREFEPPIIDKTHRKRTFADSSFYQGSMSSYPTIEENIALARKVAESIHSPINKESKGANMFQVQRKRADKHVKEGPEPIFDPIANATQEELAHMTPPKPPPAPPPPAASFPTLRPTSSKAGPSPIVAPSPGQPKSVQEFIEKIRTFPKSLHNEVDPQICFDLAASLYTSDSRGADMFAKRRERAQKWEVTAAQRGAHSKTLPQSVQARPVLASKLQQQFTDKQGPSIVAYQDKAVKTNACNPVPTRVNLVFTPNLEVSSNDGIQSEISSLWKAESPAENWKSPLGISNTQRSQNAQWRAVKFNIPQRSS